MNVDKRELKKALETAIEKSVSTMEGKKDKARKFDESIDLILNVRDVDIKNPSNRIDQEYLLPHSIKGNNKKVCFIAKGDMEVSLKEKGYPVMNTDDLDQLQKKSNKEKKQFVKQYDYFVAQAPLMRNVAKVLARFLGQQGKMPKPLPKGYGIIRPNENLDDYLAKLDRIIKVIMKKQLVVQLKVGKKSQSIDALMENVDSVLSLIEGKLPNGFNNVRTMFFKTTMGKPVKVADAGKGKK